MFFIILLSACIGLYIFIQLSKCQLNTLSMGLGQWFIQSPSPKEINSF